MQPEPPEPGSARDWLRRARSDFALARVGPQPDVMYNELCFHAQQTVEKCLKAILVDRNIEFPRVHNIAYLFGLLPGDGVSFTNPKHTSHNLGCAMCVLPFAIRNSPFAIRNSLHLIRVQFLQPLRVIGATGGA